MAEAEGEKKSIQLKADAELYKAQKEAEAIRVEAEATAFAIVTKAKADADQTKMLAAAIAKDGLPAVEFEVAKRQVEALGTIAASGNAKTIVIPTEATAAIGALSSVLGVMNEKSKKGG